MDVKIGSHDVIFSARDIEREDGVSAERKRRRSEGRDHEVQCSGGRSERSGEVSPPAEQLNDQALLPPPPPPQLPPTPPTPPPFIAATNETTFHSGGATEGRQAAADDDGDVAATVGLGGRSNDGRTDGGGGGASDGRATGGYCRYR